MTLALEIVVYLAIGLTLVWLLDDHPSPSSLIPLVFWPVLVVATIFMILLKPIKDKMS